MSDLTKLYAALKGVSKSVHPMSSSRVFKNGNKRPILVLRPHLEALFLEKNPSHFFDFTVINQGNGVARNVKCVLFSEFNGTFTQRDEVALILFPGQERKITFAGYRATNETFHALIYDVINDPFPVLNIKNFGWNQKNLVKNGQLTSSKINSTSWNEFDVDASGRATSSPNRTWKGIANRMNDSIGKKPPFTYHYKAYNTKLAVGELRQEIDFRTHPNTAEIMRAIGKDELSFYAESYMCVYKQSPRDEAQFSIRFTESNGATTPYNTRQITNLTWSRFLLNGDVKKTAQKVTVVLNTERHSGSNNDGYFGNPAFFLKHRQMFSLHAENQVFVINNFLIRRV